MDSPAPISLADLDLDTQIAVVLAAHAPLVEAWLAGTPGSWGALAGRAVLATRQALGRRLTDGERRIVWRVTWDQLGRGAGRAEPSRQED